MNTSISFLFLYIQNRINNCTFKTRGYPSPQHVAPSGCGWKKWSPDMEVSCECNEQAVAGSQQGGGPPDRVLHEGLRILHR